MLDYAGLGPEFREFAMATAVHIHNRTFRRGVDDIPLHTITGSTPSLSYMRTFGCPAYVHVPRAIRPKVAPSAREGVFVGYSSDSPAWLDMMPDTRVVLTSRSVAFNETDRLGRFDAELPYEWHAATPEGIARYKVRLCAKGFSRVHGLDFTETFAPTVNFTTLRVIFSIVAYFKLHCEQTNVDCAFILYADLKEDSYMDQPVGFEQRSPADSPRLVCLLMKAIYDGNEIFSIIAVYVGDILICSNSPSWIADFKASLGATSDIKDLGTCRWLLGMALERNRDANTVTINQSKYIKDLLQHFGMEDSKPAATPTSANDLRESPLLDDIMASH
eukprot:jgi/Tetstr1/456774/TSEL_004141.t1